MFCFFKFFLFGRMLPCFGGSVCLLFSIISSCTWNWTVRRGSRLSTSARSSVLWALVLLEDEEGEGDGCLTPAPYTDILGCSISKSSIGLDSKASGESPLASKHGGGVTYQLSSNSIWHLSFEASFPSPAKRNILTQRFCKIRKVFGANYKILCNCGATQIVCTLVRDEIRAHRSISRINFYVPKEKLL